MPFIQTQPPQLKSFLTLKQSQKMTNIDFCPHLFTLAKSVHKQQLSYLILPTKQGYITIITLQNGCLLSKYNMQIMYAYNWKITMLHSHTIHQAKKDSACKLGKGTYLFIGFQDGSLAMYILLQNGHRPLVQIFKIKNNLPKRQPVINVQIYGSNLIIAFAYNIVINLRIFANEHQPGSNKKKQIIQQKILKSDINSCKLDIALDLVKQQLYIFNQYEGSVCVDLLNNKEIKRIQDSIKILTYFNNNNILAQQNKDKDKNNSSIDIAVTGCTDDTVKFIDYTSGVVQKYSGLKNYPSCFCHDTDNNILWVGCLDGCIICFSYYPPTSTSPLISPSISQPQKKQFLFQQHKIKYKQKISQNGIKKIVVYKNTLIVFDCDHNIQLYDICRQASTTTQRFTTSMANQNTSEQEESGEEEDMDYIQEVQLGSK